MRAIPRLTASRSPSRSVASLLPSDSVAARSSYSDFLKADLGAMIDALGLSDLQKHMVHARWLDQVLWMERRANAARDRYYALRLTTIVGGVILPALVSLNVSDSAAAGPIVRWSTFLVTDGDRRVARASRRATHGLRLHSS